MRSDTCAWKRKGKKLKQESKLLSSREKQCVHGLRSGVLLDHSPRWLLETRGVCASQVEFMLCYAMTGGQVRICMLHRDAPDSCHVVSGVHNMYETRGRLALLRIAVLLYRILAIQQTELPSSAMPLGSELKFSSGTTITVMGDHVIKRVDIRKQPHLVEQLAEVQKLYQATKASKHLIRSKEGPDICTKYKVTLYRFGEQLGSGCLFIRIQSLAQLKAAIRCVLLALRPSCRKVCPH